MITDFDIQALIDNELDWEREKLVRSQIQESVTLKKQYQELIKQRDTLKIWANYKLKN
jgi:hypothetical protein